MRRRRSMFVGIAVLLFLCVCCGLVAGIGSFFASHHPCTSGVQGSGITVLQDQRADDITACGGRVMVLGHVVGDVVSYGGPITVEETGRVDGDIKSYGGPVEIAGEVRGDVSSYGGRVTLDATAQVRGDVTAYGGGITREPGARVDGSIERDRPSRFGWDGTSLLNPIGFTFPTLSIIIWALIAAALAHWVPQRLLCVGEVMFGAMPRCLAIGALSWVLGLMLALILVLIIIGLPVALALVLVLVAGGVMGNVSVGWLIGRWVLQRVGSREHTPVMEAVVGVVILTLLEAIPFVGVLFGAFIAVLGVGATFLSRFGARRWRPPVQRRWAA